MWKPKGSKERKTTWKANLSMQSMSQKIYYKVLRIPYMTVWTWINKEGQKADKKVMSELERLKRQGKVKAISIDEMWGYVRTKGNEVWNHKEIFICRG